MSAVAERFRPDGVKILHDPFAPGMVEKYGRPGATDNEGFDPYADTVGPGIYGGIVKRNKDGSVVVGQQYQNHNPRPGPVYAGGGYTPVNVALRAPAKLAALLTKYPDLTDDVSTGGARPLHMCGMGKDNEGAVPTLVMHGADVNAVDTYGFTPLHRMASNNLARGALALLKAGAAQGASPGVGSPLEVAKQSRATDVVRTLQEWKPKRVRVEGGHASTNGEFLERAHRIPDGFSKVCDQQGWERVGTWLKLAGPDAVWYEAPSGAYIYFNNADGQWWIDAPEGHGVYVAKGKDALTKGPWKPLNRDPPPTVQII